MNEILTQDLIAVRHVLGSTRAEVAGSEIGGFCPSLSHKHNRPHYCPISGDKSPATVSPSFQETQLSRAGEIYTDGEKVPKKSRSLCFLIGRSFSWKVHLVLCSIFWTQLCEFLMNSCLGLLLCQSIFLALSLSLFQTLYTLYNKRSAFQRFEIYIWIRQNAPQGRLAL